MLDTLDISSLNSSMLTILYQKSIYLGRDSNLIKQKPIFGFVWHLLGPFSRFLPQV